MPLKTIVISYSVYESHSDLCTEDQDLLLAAEDGLISAYAPYSQFKVGAAIILENGRIIIGNNQENMAFPSGLCAERVALFAAASANPGVKIMTVAITARSGEFPVEEPVTPCGCCRQALIEYENNQRSPIRIILGCESQKVIIIDRVADLLPLSFRGEMLKK
jgi:cytidine deaminase